MLARRWIDAGIIGGALSVAVACGSDHGGTASRGGGASGGVGGAGARSGSSGSAGANGGSLAAGTAGNAAGSANAAASGGGGTGGQATGAGSAGIPSGGAQAGGRGGTGGSGQAGAAGTDTLAEGGAAGVTGEAGTGNVGEAGAASSGDAYQCPGGAFTSYQRNATVRQTTQGTNGTFTDRCDEDDNLVEYLCESELVSAVGYINTGEVASMPSDCGGRCVDGACPNICPIPHTPMLFVAVESNGETTLQDTVTGFTYDCNLTAQAAPGACDSFEVGDEVENYYSTDCIGQTVTMTLGWDGLEYCAYTSCAMR